MVAPLLSPCRLLQEGIRPGLCTRAAPASSGRALGRAQPHSTPEFQGDHTSGRSGLGRGVKSLLSGERPRWPSRSSSLAGAPAAARALQRGPAAPPGGQTPSLQHWPGPGRVCPDPRGGEGSAPPPSDAR